MALMRNNNDEMSARRRRDSRGRYMEGDYGGRMGMEDYGPRSEYDLYVMPQGRQMGFGARDDYDMNDNDIRRRNTGRENGDFSEQGEHRRYPTSNYGGRRMSMGGMGMPHMQQMRMGGMRQYGMRGGKAEPLTREKAMMWVQSMDGESEKGETWTFEEIEEIAEKHGMPMQEKKLVEFYAVMNMLASDYYKVAEKFDVLEDDFFVCMAKAFIDDKDAVPDKVAMYYECIAKKD